MEGGSSRGHGGYSGRPYRGRSNGNQGGRRPPKPTSANEQRQRQRDIANQKVDMRQYNRMIADNERNFADIIQTGQHFEECTICWKKNDMFGIGHCRHPICIECAIKMRILGESSICPTCRGELAEMSFIEASAEMDTKPLDFSATGHPAEARYKIKFENQVISARYDKYLAHICKVCQPINGERVEFPSFISLRQHMAQMHQLSFCQICTANLNQLSRERKLYSREQLQRHIHSGDPEDKSQIGHPSCLFCEERFFDEEAQYRHLRKEHFFCQFCESSGAAVNEFFKTHKELITHYEKNHFVCNVPECKQAGIAFGNEFDMRLHATREHGSRQALGLDFTFNDRQLGRGARGRAQPSLQQRSEPLPLPSRGVVLVDTEPAPAPDRSNFVVVHSAQHSGPIRFSRFPDRSVQRTEEQFPSLPGSSQPSTTLNPSAFPRLNKVNKGGAPQKAKASDNQDIFPALGGNSSVKKQHNPDWGVQRSGNVTMVDVDEQRNHITASSQARTQAASAPVQQLSRPQPPEPPSSIPQSAAKTKPAKKIAQIEPECDFPDLPAAGPSSSIRPAALNAKSKTFASKVAKAPVSQLQNVGGLLAHKTEKQPRKKKQKKKLEPYEPPEYVEPPEPEWQDVPVKPAKSSKSKNTAGSKLNAIVGVSVPKGFQALRAGQNKSESESEQDLTEEAEVPNTQCVESNSSETDKIDTDENYSLSPPVAAKKSEPISSKQAKSTPSSPKPKKEEKQVEDFPALQPKDAPSDGILSNFFSFRGMLSSLTSSWTNPITTAPPPGLQRSVSEQSDSSQKPSQPTVVAGPPPGFENVVPRGAPPTFSNAAAKPPAIVEEAPVVVQKPIQPPVGKPSISNGWGLFTADDLAKDKKAHEAALKATAVDDGWETLPKKNAKKK